MVFTLLVEAVPAALNKKMLEEGKNTSSDWTSGIS